MCTDQIETDGLFDSRRRTTLLRVEQRAAESEHLRSLINANPLPEGGRRFSRGSDMSEKSVTSEE
jgi:hypothetical protein